MPLDSGLSTHNFSDLNTEHRAKAVLPIELNFLLWALLERFNDRTPRIDDRSPCNQIRCAALTIAVLALTITWVALTIAALH